jgi:hypothetical protein
MILNKNGSTASLNYLNIFLTTDLLSNLENENYFQVGFGLNYNLVFNRLPRY